MLAACGRGAVEQPQPAGPLAAAESLYLELRDVRDRIDVAAAASREVASDGTPVVALAARHHDLRRAVSARLAGVDSAALGADDRRALGAMRRTLEGALAPVSPASDAPVPAAEWRPECGYDPATLARGARGADSLRARIYACYGWAQHHVVVDADTLDRLTVYAELARAEDRERRRRLFLALDPVWRSINGRNEAGSPYRTLIALDARARGPEAAAREARAAGVPPDSLEPWLVRVLEAWRSAAPDSLIEPWDWHYLAGRPARELGSRVPRERLRDLNAAIYRAVGADLRALNVRYDLEPRQGKTPVAFCTFGARPRLVGGRWAPGEPSVFATYRTGGVDNLAELLHETGHAIHIAAIRTRPAFADWPDSDPFSEAVADFVALDVAEPVWQQRWLGDSVPLADGLRSRYAGIVLDVAWSLFELRMLREPAADPNQVWTALTSDYLRIRPHPELSWWAMRGQLVDAPGYMMNYAAGAILIAALRARAVSLRGSWIGGDAGWYRWVSERLFRFGLERPAREVVEAFLGGPVTPGPLLRDMARMKQ